MSYIPASSNSFGPWLAKCPKRFKFRRLFAGVFGSQIYRALLGTNPSKLSLHHDLSSSVQGSALPSEAAALGWLKKPCLVHLSIVVRPKQGCSAFNSGIPLVSLSLRGLKGMVFLICANHVLPSLQTRHRQYAS